MRSAMQILADRGYESCEFKTEEERQAEYDRLRRETALEMSRSANENAKQSRRNKLEQRMKRAAIPEVFQGRTLDNYIATTPKQVEVVDRLRFYVEHFEQMQAGPTHIVLHGDSRRGKGHLACAVANALMQQGEMVLYARSVEIWRTLRDSYKSKHVTETEVLNSFADPDLLVVDEVGRESGDWRKAAQFVGEIFNKRHEANKPTILITNLARKDLGGMLGDHIWYRLVENQGAVIECDWGRYVK